MRVQREVSWTIHISVALLFVVSALIIQLSYQDDPGTDELVFENWLNQKRTTFMKMYPGSQDIISEGVADNLPTRSAGGNREWIVELPGIVDQPGGKYCSLSTPSLADLNDDGMMEILISSPSDYLYALDSSGGYYWEEPYTDLNIAQLGESGETSILDFDPPQFFSAPAHYDFGGDLGDRIFVGTSQGLLCLDDEGDRLWQKEGNGNYVFSTPSITDLEGYFTNMSNYEIIVGMDDKNRQAWLCAFDAKGNMVMEEEVIGGSEGSFIGMSVVAQDHDGDFCGDHTNSDPGFSVERDTELSFGTHDHALRIYQRQEQGGGDVEYEETTQGFLGGHQTYATHAIANVSGDRDCEIFVGSSEGYTRTWAGWGGKLYVFKPNARRLWDYHTGSVKASIFSSPVIADLQQSHLDPTEEILDYEVIFGADTGKLYVLNTMTHSLNWMFNTGGRVLSSPAVCNINSDDELEIIVASDSGKVFCLEGDPSDDIDHGIAYPGDGPSQDVLWVYDVNTTVGVSSPVVGDIDRDGQLEVVIGDDLGRVHCISCGGTSTLGQMDWPESHGNSNRTGVYHPQDTIRPDLHPEIDENGNPCPTEVEGKPGERIVFNLTLDFNVRGDNYDKDQLLRLKIPPASVPENWSARIGSEDPRWDPEEQVARTGSGEDLDLKLIVETPQECRPKESAGVKIVVKYPEFPYILDSLIAFIVTDVSLDFLVEFEKGVSTDPLDPLMGMKWDRILPESQVVFDLKVLNRGDLNDTYHLKLNDPPTGWDWKFPYNSKRECNVSLSAERFSHLGTSSGILLDVIVECPEFAVEGTNLPLRIRGESLLSGKYRLNISAEMDELILSVGPVTDLQMISHRSVIHGVPGERVTDNLLLTNTGNYEHSIYLEVNGSRSKYQIDFPSEYIELMPGQSVTIPLRVGIPDDSHAGAKLDLEVKALIEGKDQGCRVTLTVITSQIFEIHGRMDEIGTINAYPGDEVVIPFKVVNRGNGPDELLIHGEEDSLGEETVIRDYEGKPVKSKILGREAVASFTASTTIPEGYPVGTYDVCIVVDNGLDRILINRSVRVLQVRNLTTRFPDGSCILDVPTVPGKRVEIDLVIENNGNGKDTADIDLLAKGEGRSFFRMDPSWDPRIMYISTSEQYQGPLIDTGSGRHLDLTGSPANRVYSVPEDIQWTGGPGDTYSVSLPRSGVGYVKIGFSPPRDLTRISPEGTESVIAIERDDPKNSSLLRVLMDFRYPDLQFDGDIEISSQEGDGIYERDLTRIAVPVKNIGESDARYVDIQLSIDGECVRNVTAPLIKAGGSPFVAVFSWIAEEGDHDIVIYIDPSNCVQERDESVSYQQPEEMKSIRRSITVGNTDGFNFTGLLIWLIPMITLIIIILTLLIVSRDRNK